MENVIYYKGRKIFYKPTKKTTEKNRADSFKSEQSKFTKQETAALTYFKSSVPVTINRLAAWMKIPNSTASRLLNSLYKKQKIKIIGSIIGMSGKQNTAYQLRYDNDPINVIKPKKKEVELEIYELRKCLHEQNIKISIIEIELEDLKNELLTLKKN